MLRKLESFQSISLQSVSNPLWMALKETPETEKVTHSSRYHVLSFFLHLRKESGGLALWAKLSCLFDRLIIENEEAKQLIERTLPILVNRLTLCHLPPSFLEFAFDLRQAEQLESVVLKDIGCRDEGLAEILPELMSLPRLRSLDLRGNALTDRAASAILKALANHPSLRVVHLNENPDISADFFRKIDELLRENNSKSMTHIGLFYPIKQPGSSYEKTAS